ncbi:MAG: serine/threonine-protein kinase [bacterium]
MTPYLFGKYCLLERVSVGGMAEVFRAKPLNAPNFNGYLALKRILPHLAEDDEFIMMFVDEAKLTVQLNHPNIVKIYELGQFQASYYILMEFIAGKDLLTLQKRVRKRREVIGVNRSVYIAREIARGLHHAHQQVDANGVPLNIIHRDVSPQNVLVDYLGQIKVIDFGIAKAAVQSTRTQVGVLKGKMGYMSPEQVMGNPLDPRSDVFAIGTVLWEMLTNKRLFNADNEFETMQLVKSARVDPPSTANDEIPPDLDAIVLRALTADRNDRYPSALAFAEALDGWLATHPCTADDLSLWMREVFAEDLEEELNKREEFAAIVTADDVRKFTQKESAPDPSPEDNYEKTEIWSGELPSDVDPFRACGAAQLSRPGI